LEFKIPIILIGFYKFNFDTHAFEYNKSGNLILQAPKEPGRSYFRKKELGVPAGLKKTEHRLLVFILA